jgi:hypothetical protein
VGNILTSSATIVVSDQFKNERANSINETKETLTTGDARMWQLADMSLFQAFHHYSQLIWGLKVEIANFISVHFTKMENNSIMAT